MGKAFGIVALIFGIISIPLAGILGPMTEVLASLGGLFGIPEFANFIIILGWIFIGVAILFGIIGIIVDKPKSVAVVGLVLGIISLILRFSIGYLLSLLTP